MGSDSGGCRTHELCLAWGEDPSNHPVSFLFFAQESSESTNTTIEDEDTKGTGRGTQEGGQAVSEGCSGVVSPATPNEILAMAKPMTIELPRGPSEVAFIPWG